MDVERKLVTVRRISALDPIPGADLIEVAAIDGWKVVVKKGDFQVGDDCLYFEIDSFIKETDQRFEFLMKSGVRTFNGVRGHRLKTIRLRKQLSQGMALPLSWFPEILKPTSSIDFAKTIGIVKWEPPTNANTSMRPGLRKHGFPSFIRKTDQERAQNIPHEIFKNPNTVFEITEKLDGSSTTFFRNEGKLGVCSRNVLLYKTEDTMQRWWGLIVATVRRALGMQVFTHDPTNPFVRIFKENGIENFLNMADQYGYTNFALQGELIGPTIQNNFHNLKEFEFYLFDVWDIDNQEYWSQYDRDILYETMVHAGVRIKHVPIIKQAIKLNDLDIKTIDHLLSFADGPGLGTNYREGVVFKSNDGKFSFKIVSNHYLLKEKDNE